jgi:acetyl esterase/lipase
VAPDRDPAEATHDRRSFLGTLIAGAVLLGAGACGGPAPVPEATVYDRQRMPYGAHPRQTGDLTVPRSKGPHPVLVLIHGGYWKPGVDRSTLVPLAEALSRRGYAVWNIDYRTIGADGGGWPGTFDDVAAAIDHLASIGPPVGLDLSRVAAVGHSAGGQLALWATARERVAARSPAVPAGTAPPGSALAGIRPVVSVQGAVSLAGVPDLAAAASVTGAGHPGELRRAVVDLLGGSPDQVAERYALASPRELLPLGVPQLLVHGLRDDRVPVQQARDYTAAAQRAGDHIRLIELPTGDHGDIARHDRPAWPDIEAWLDTVTNPSP